MDYNQKWLVCQPPATEGRSTRQSVTRRTKQDGGERPKENFTTFAGVLLAGQVAGQTPDIFIAGDDAAARDQVSRMVESMGLRPIDVGPLRRARQLEGLGLLNIALAMSRNTNFLNQLKFLP